MRSLVLRFESRTLAQPCSNGALSIRASSLVSRLSNLLTALQAEAGHGETRPQESLISGEVRHSECLTL